MDGADAGSACGPNGSSGARKPAAAASTSTLSLLGRTLFSRLRLSSPTKAAAARAHDGSGSDAAFKVDQHDAHSPSPSGPSPFQNSTAPPTEAGARSAPAASNQHLHAQPSLDTCLTEQQSWGSPRSDPRPSEAGECDALRACSSYGSNGRRCTFSSGGGGGGQSSSAGGRRSGRPAGVPPLHLERLAGDDESKQRSRRNTTSTATTPPITPPMASSSTPCGASPQQYIWHVLRESVSELEEELAAWAAPPKWHPSGQGRVYVYPPISRRDIAPVEALVEGLGLHQREQVVQLWRKYAAARYSAELMAGRAVRMCKEYTREINTARAEQAEMQREHAAQMHRMGQAMMQMQQELDETRRAAAAAMANSAALQQQQQHRNANHCHKLPAPSQGAPANAGSRADGHDSPTRHRHTGTPPPSVAAAQPARQGGACGGDAAAMQEIEALTSENEDLAAQLDHVHALYLQAHEEGRALREALVEADAANRALHVERSSLRRHAAAVVSENNGLRREVAQLHEAFAGAAFVDGHVGGHSGGRASGKRGAGAADAHAHIALAHTPGEVGSAATLCAGSGAITAQGRYTPPPMAAGYGEGVVVVARVEVKSLGTRADGRPPAHHHAGTQSASARAQPGREGVLEA